MKTKIYNIDINSKKYIKLKKPFTSIFMPNFLISILVLILAYVGDEILNINIATLYLLYVYLLIVIYMVVKKIVDWIIFVKIGNTCIIKGKNEILFLYGDTSNYLLDSLKKSDTKTKEKNNDIVGDLDALIERILNDPKTSYEYYKDIKFMKKNNNFLYFNGNKINYDGTIKNKAFKVDRKLYKNVDDILD